MRVISGIAKGRKIDALQGKNTRPTSDRVKEALFGILHFKCVDALVLDLFSGSGSLGIEAISRGAQKVYFNDQDPAAAQLIRKNIQKLGFEEKAQVFSLPYQEAINRTSQIKFDIVLLDPPYGLGLENDALSLLLQKDMLAEDAFICIEHEWHNKPAIPEGMDVDSRRYGKTGLSILGLEELS